MGSASRVHDDADAGGRGQLPHAVRQPVAQIHAARRRAVVAELQPCPDAGRRVQIAFLARRYRQQPGLRVRRAGAQALEPDRRRPEPSGHVDAVAGARPLAPSTRRAGAPTPARSRSRPRGPLVRVTLPPTIATCSAAACATNPSRKPSTTSTGSVAGSASDSSGGPRPRAHGRQVAEVHGQRAVADRPRRHEPRVEVHAVHERVGGHHVEGVANGCEDGRVVARAHDDPRRGRPGGS